MNPFLKLPTAERHSLILVWLVSLHFALAVFQSPAAAAELSIPGTLTVTIEPAGAVEAGARWSLDGGEPQASDESVGSLAAGTHTVQFSNLAAWLEPEDVELLVIGGKKATMTATYRPLPRFYFRDVPGQRAKVGTTIDFLVHTDDPGDPQNPGPETALQMTATAPPTGALTFDQTSGRIAYTPSVADRLPFTVRLATAQGLAGSFEMTPVNALALEDSVIEYDRPVPDEESRDYIALTESENAPETFNDALTATFNASVSGKTLVFAANHPANLHRQFDGRKNLKELQLFADRVIIRSPLLLPQTHVVIHARELRFEGNGVLDTTPQARTNQPTGATWEDNLNAGIDGVAGHPGGDVDVFVETFFSDATTATRFVMRGGAGGPPGEGRDGRNEVDVVYESADWQKLMQRAGNRVCESDLMVAIFRQRTFNDEVTSTCGSPTATARGERAVPSGIPGAGGRGGFLRSTVNLVAHAQVSGGNAGAGGRDYIGGTLSSRRYVYRYITAFFEDGRVHTSTRNDNAPKVPGANASAPTGTPGAAGSLQLVPDAGAWLHSFSLRGVVQFAKDAYLNGRISEARAILSDYQQLLRAHPRSLPPDEEVSDAVFAEAANLDQLAIEIENLLHRIDSNLDYFGNPAGWVPMLSFEANLLAFQNEIQQSVPILYLAYFLNHAATNLQSSVLATEQAKADLEAERARMETSFNEAQLTIPNLKHQAEVMTVQIGNLRQRIALKLSVLEQRARQNVEDRHKLPLWKKALGVLSVAADLIPVGQPTIGRIGAGLGLLAQIDPDKPLESAKAIAPQAFGVMTNKNISVCFGTNSVANTNSPSGTNTVKKAKQDKLKRATECAKFLGGELKELAAIFKEAQVDDKELAAELEQLKASDVELQELTLEVEALNAEKARFAQELAVALQVIGSFSSSLAENLVATHELEERLANGLAALDHGALLHIKEMERRAKDRLLQYQYFLAKSFHYRRLRPYTGNLQLTRLLTRFQVVVETSSSHLLSQQEFENLKGIFINELREIVAQMTDNVNAPQRSDPASFSLKPDELQQLNEQGFVAISLLDASRRALLGTDRENIRIADLRVLDMDVLPVGGPIGNFAIARVKVEHSGISRLTQGGSTFLFRHYQSETATPIAWNAVYDSLTGIMQNSVLSASELSLLSVLLGNNSNTNLLFFSQPAAMTEFLITKDVATDNGIDLVITNLHLQIQFDFDNTSGNRRELVVNVAGDLQPVIVVGQADFNGRQDGQGDFARLFAPFSLVTLQAPPTYGEFVFDRWFINGQPQTTQVPAVAVFLSDHTQVEARYRLAAGPLVLTPVATAPGQIGFSFSSEPGVTYTLEQTPRLNNPNWTTVETRTGDGSTIQFTRPIGATPTTFFRVRQEP